MYIVFGLTMILFIVVFRIAFVKEIGGISKNNIELVIESFIISVLASIIGFIVLMFINVGIGNLFFESEYVYTKYVPIVSMNDRFNTEGHFTLGSGTIENKSYYYYYYKGEDGIYQSKIASKNVPIVEDSECIRPRIEIWEERWIVEPNNHWLVRTGNKKRKIIVPSNSVVKQYRFDLQ